MDAKRLADTHPLQASVRGYEWHCAHVCTANRKYVRNLCHRHLLDFIAYTVATTGLGTFGKDCAHRVATEYIRFDSGRVAAPVGHGATHRPAVFGTGWCRPPCQNGAAAPTSTSLRM